MGIHLRIDARVSEIIACIFLNSTCVLCPGEKGRDVQHKYFEIAFVMGSSSKVKAKFPWKMF